MVRSIEREALGNAHGRTLLHLQCNTGSDTLSWARLGARGAQGRIFLVTIPG